MWLLTLAGTGGAQVMPCCIPLPQALSHAHGCTGLPSLAPLFIRQGVLERGLAEATTWADFQARALELDVVCGHDKWKRRFECELYDYDLVRDVLDDLYEARRSNNARQALYLLRSTLRRNLGGACTHVCWYLSSHTLLRHGCRRAVPRQLHRDQGPH